MLSPAERRRVAYHEMGHALVAASLPDVDPVQKVSIIPRGVGALGYTIQRPTEDRFVLSTSELRHRITVLMGGRAAEALIFSGDVSTGAADDLERATEIAVEMVTRYGMADIIGPRVYKAPPPLFLGTHSIDKPAASEATLREIDVAVHDITAVALRRGAHILAHGGPISTRAPNCCLTQRSHHQRGFSSPRQSGARRAAARARGRSWLERDEEKWEPVFRPHPALNYGMITMAQRNAPKLR